MSSGRVNKELTDPVKRHLYIRPATPTIQQNAMTSHTKIKLKPKKNQEIELRQKENNYILKKEEKIKRQIRNNMGKKKNQEIIKN